MKPGAEFRQLVGSRIFGATFRNARGELRSGAYRFGVRRNLKGAGRGYDADARGNVTVWDMRAGCYLTIKLERVERLRVRGIEVKP